MAHESNLNKYDHRFRDLGLTSMVLGALVLLCSVFSMAVCQLMLGSIPPFVEMIFMLSLGVPMLGLLLSIIYGAGKECYKLFVFFLD